jgi:serine/threonine protein kinase
MPFSIVHTITPWMPQGTLLDFIKSPSYEADILRVQLVCAGGNLKDLTRAYPQLREVAQALEYLHSMCLVHGDLKFVGSFKPPYQYVVLNCDCYQTNILVDDDNHARVADVGLSTIVGPSFDRSVASNNSARWMAPELVADLNAEETPGPTTNSDVFSFGRLIYAVRVPLSIRYTRGLTSMFTPLARFPPSVSLCSTCVPTSPSCCFCRADGSRRGHRPSTAMACRCPTRSGSSLSTVGRAHLTSGPICLRLYNGCNFSSEAISSMPAFCIHICYLFLVM